MRGEDEVRLDMTKEGEEYFCAVQQATLRHGCHGGTDGQLLKIEASHSKPWHVRSPVFKGSQIRQSRWSRAGHVTVAASQPMTLRWRSRNAISPLGAHQLQNISASTRRLATMFIAL